VAKKRKFVKWIVLGLVLGVVLLIVSLAHLYINVMPKKQLERKLAKIRARGEPVTLEEAAPPEIPDAENAALVYEQAFSFYYNPGRDEEVKLGEIAGKDLAEWTEEDTAVIREDLEKNQDCLRLLHDAANYDKCRFPLDYSQGFALPLPHLSKMRNCARLLAREAFLKTKEGKIDAALQSTWASLRLGKAFMDEPILVSHFVHIATDAIAFDALQEILSENDAPSGRLKRLLREVDIEEHRQAFINCMQGELCFGRATFDEVRENPERFWNLVVGLNGRPLSPSTGSKKGDIAIRIFRKSYLKRDEAHFLKAMQRLIGLCKRVPFNEVKTDIASFLLQEVAKSPFYCRLTRMLTFNLAKAPRAQARHEARIGLAQLALALKIFKAEKGKYPDFLTELVPDILPQLPQDPLTGKDFVYKKEAEGFLVYSLGENGTDEGGKWDEKKVYQHDIPWRCKR